MEIIQSPRPDSRRDHRLVCVVTELVQEADFSNADLRGADLDGAILHKTNFEHTHMSEKDLNKGKR